MAETQVKRISFMPPITEQGEQGFAKIYGVHTVAPIKRSGITASL